MGLFHLCDHTESGGHLIESLFFGNVCKFGIELCPFFVLAVSGSFQVLGRGADDTGRIGGGDLHHSAFEEFEKAFGVFFFVEGRLGKDGRDLFQALFLGLLGEIIITHSGLRLPCKGLQQVLFGTCSFQ